jgi:hypothetical protein
MEKILKGTKPYKEATMKTAFVLAIIFTVGGISWVATRIVKDITFDRGCKGYLKRAADANTVEMAKRELAIAVKWAKENERTEGYTSILYNTPDEDMGFWYGNISKALEELESITEESTPLERSNMLMKLRETLLDDKGSGVGITVPSGIHLYPHNGLFAVWGLFTWIFAIFAWFYFLYKADAI